MKKVFEKTDLYEDIKGATLDNLNRNTQQLKLSVIQAIAYYVHEMEGIFEDNELERILTLIPIGVFAVKNNCFDSIIVKEITYAINEIESNKYNKLLHNGDRELINKDIMLIKQYSL